MVTRVHVGDPCPICKDAVISNLRTTTDEIECFKRHPWGVRYLCHWMEDVLAALENPTQLPLPLEEQLPKKKVIDEFPHRCPYCNARAYIGLLGLDVFHADERSAFLCPAHQRK